MILLEKIRRRSLTGEYQHPSLSRSKVQFSELPTEIFIDILSRLPAKSVAKCRCVSKLWRSTLLLPNFTDSFFTRSTAHPQLLLSCLKDGTISFFKSPHEFRDSDSGIADYHIKYESGDTDSEVCGSVNGLVCVNHVRNCEIAPVVCNISTGQSLLTLPKVVTKKRKKIEVKSLFGYDPVKKQYKILAMTRVRPSYGVEVRNFTGEYQVLTLGVKKPSWRMVDCSTNHTPFSHGVCIGGGLYYLATINNKPRWNCVVVWFDVRTEKFRFAEGDEDMCLTDSVLVNYKGKLGALLSDGFEGKFHRVVGGTRSLEMRVLEDPVKRVWSKHVFEMPPLWKYVVGDYTLYFVGVVGGTNEIVLAPQPISDPFHVFYYNIERKTTRRVEIQGLGALKGSEAHISVDHVENVKFMEMFKTYNLRSAKRS